MLGKGVRGRRGGKQLGRGVGTGGRGDREEEVSGRERDGESRCKEWGRRVGKERRDMEKPSNIKLRLIQIS